MSSTELATVTTDEAALARLDRHAVVELLERGKTWLQQALQRDTEIGDFVTYKAEASVLRELTVQMELGKDAELAATELVRRAERAIGQAIRKGQQDGRVTSHGQHAFTGNQYGPPRGVLADDENSSDPTPVSPTSFGLSEDQLSRGAYALADNVTEDEFQEALDAAKEEGNLSRAAVARKLGKKAKEPVRRPEVLRRTRRFDSKTVVAKTVEAAADVVTPSLLAEVDYGELDTQDLGEWISSLGDSIRALSSLKAQLSKELNHRG